MSTRPTDAGSFAEAVYAQMQPVAQDDVNNGWALLLYLGAVGQMLQLLDEAAHSDPPWYQLLDLDNCPTVGLPWLGQFFGVVIPVGLTDLQERTLIRQHKSWYRGTVESIIEACQVYLTGTKTVTIVERDTSPYHFAVYTYASETVTDATYATTLAAFADYTGVYSTYATYSAWYMAGSTTQIMTNAILTEKPAGLQFTYTTLSGSPSTSDTYLDVLEDFTDYPEIPDERQSYQSLLDNP